jgi:hypothetical protein
MLIQDKIRDVTGEISQQELEFGEFRTQVENRLRQVRSMTKDVKGKQSSSDNTEHVKTLKRLKELEKKMEANEKMSIHFKEDFEGLKSEISQENDLSEFKTTVNS